MVYEFIWRPVDTLSPEMTEAVIAAGAIVATLSLAPIIVGFGTVGITAGSTAAAIQSGIGCVQAGSWFATMTSLGMQGTFVYGTAGGVSVAASATSVKLGAAAAAANFFTGAFNAATDALRKATSKTTANPANL